MIEKPQTLLTIALVIEEQGNEGLTHAQLIDLICSCNKNLEPPEAKTVIREWLRLEVLVLEEDGFWVDPEIAIELIESAIPALTEDERATWIRKNKHRASP